MCLYFQTFSQVINIFFNFFKRLNDFPKYIRPVLPAGRKPYAGLSYIQPCDKYLQSINSLLFLVTRNPHNK